MLFRLTRISRPSIRGENLVPRFLSIEGRHLGGMRGQGIYTYLAKVVAVLRLCPSEEHYSNIPVPLNQSLINFAPSISSYLYIYQLPNNMMEQVDFHCLYTLCCFSAIFILHYLFTTTIEFILAGIIL